jgi:prepilin-type N-terminal cleavage/methylation domain-containing protein
MTRLTQAYTKGFTLIELLVVVAVVSLVSSVVFVGINTSRVSARDLYRVQEVNQINNAIQLYISVNGKVPTLAGECGTDMFIFEPLLQETCVAMSNASLGTYEADAWTALAVELSPYMKTMPKDPCPSCTTVESRASGAPGESPGYVYIAPAALNYYCVYGTGGGLDFCDSQKIDESAYQVYSALEKKTAVGISSAS